MQKYDEKKKEFFVYITGLNANDGVWKETDSSRRLDESKK